MYMYLLVHKKNNCSNIHLARKSKQSAKPVCDKLSSPSYWRDLVPDLSERVNLASLSPARFLLS